MVALHSQQFILCYLPCHQPTSSLFTFKNYLHQSSAKSTLRKCPVSPLNTVTESFIERMLTQGKSSIHSPPPYLFLVVVVVYVVDKGGPTHT